MSPLEASPAFSLATIGTHDQEIFYSRETNWNLTRLRNDFFLFGCAVINPTASQLHVCCLFLSSRSLAYLPSLYSTAYHFRVLLCVCSASRREKNAPRRCGIAKMIASRRWWRMQRNGRIVFARSTKRRHRRARRTPQAASMGRGAVESSDWKPSGEASDRHRSGYPLNNFSRMLQAPQDKTQTRLPRIDNAGAKG